MIAAPRFWSHDGWPARLLSPLSPLGAVLTARRVAKPGWKAHVPVLCCGNATVGGAGKTTLTLDLAQRLIARDVAVHILLRGHGGQARAAHRVTPSDTAGTVGDEALLLAAIAPTWIGADRAASARAAIAAGAQALLMDDGLQNPTLKKTASLLVVDGASGFGNGRVLPAGPLREPVARAAARCRAAVIIGPDTRNAAAHLPRTLKILRAHLAQTEDLTGQRVFAFAGIAIPEKFFATLRQAGAILAGQASFPDHHVFTPSERAALRAQAAGLGAPLITTPKDIVRLPPDFPARAIGVRLLWDDPSQIDAMLDDLLSPPNPEPVF